MIVSSPADKAEARKAGEAERLKELRDEFAMAALQGVVSRASPDFWNQMTPQGFAAQAYLLADAMLKERDK